MITNILKTIRTKKMKTNVGVNKCSSDRMPARGRPGIFRNTNSTKSEGR